MWRTLEVGGWVLIDSYFSRPSQARLDACRAEITMLNILVPGTSYYISIKSLNPRLCNQPFFRVQPPDAYPYSGPINTQYPSSSHMAHIQSPHELFSRLDTIYGVSPTEERLLLAKTFMNLKPNGDTASMMRQWQRVTTEIEQKRYDASKLCHDIGIVLLGDFQHSFFFFFCTQLNNLFAASKKDRLHEMDMHDIIDQIESRTPPTPHTY